MVEEADYFKPKLGQRLIEKINGWQEISTVADCLPVMKEMNTGAVNWGFFSSKSTTIWNWDSRKNEDGKRRNVEQDREQGNVLKPGETFSEPEVWFHDLFQMDGHALVQK